MKENLQKLSDELEVAFAYEGLDAKVYPKIMEPTAYSDGHNYLMFEVAGKREGDQMVYEYGQEHSDILLEFPFGYMDDWDEAFVTGRDGYSTTFRVGDLETKRGRAAFIKEIWPYVYGSELKMNPKSVVTVKFSDPKYNYNTPMSDQTTPQSAYEYFVGQQIDVGPYPVENLQTVIGIDFNGEPVGSTRKQNKSLTRRQKENAIAKRLPPDSKRGRGDNRVIMLTGNSASVLGVPDYTRFTMASGMTDTQIDTLFDFLVLGKKTNPNQRRNNMDYSPNALFGPMGSIRLFSAFQVLTGLPVQGVSERDAKAIIKQMTAVNADDMSEYDALSSLAEFLDTHARLAVERGEMDLDEPYAWAVPYAQTQGFYAGYLNNPKKDRMFLYHIAHRGTAYFGLGPTPRVAKRKLDQQLKGTSVNANSPNVQQYEIDYNAVAGEGWNSKI